jgi:NitT/TauT family transport system substrate-binding protein
MTARLALELWLPLMPVVVIGGVLCVAAPERAAQQRLVDSGFTKRYDYALEALSDIPYRSWRQYDPDETRCGSRLCACSADWRFLNELKREQKA